MRIASTFLQLNSSNKKKGDTMDDEGKNDAQLPSTSNGQNESGDGPISVGKVDRLRLGAQSAMNHLIYGKWRKSMGRMPKLEGIIGNEEEECRIWLLGQKYQIWREQTEEFDESEDETIWKVGDEFLEDFRSLIWFTYRERFPPLEKMDKIGNNSSNTITTTDCGWGCALRAAQMLLGQTFLRLYFGRDFRLSNCSSLDFQKYISIIRLFEDCPFSPFGLHSLLEMAKRREWAESPIGRWYSPSEAILLLKDALFVGTDLDKGKKLSEQLFISICSDNCVILSELKENSRHFLVPILVIIPLRLGTENVNEIYFGHLQTLFSLNSFVGMIGGRPKNAVYLVGCIERLLLTLDPHTVQSYRPLNEKEGEDGDDNAKKWTSFSCDFPNTIPIENLDPSCALGFLIRNENELNEWIEEMGNYGMAELHINNRNKERMNQRQQNTLFTVLEEKQKFEKMSKNSNENLKKAGRRKQSGQEEFEESSLNGSAEFEIL